MPRRYSSSSSQPALDRPRLIPHAGLPGQDGTTRFAYSMEAVGAARDAFKLIPLLPTPLSSSSAAAGTSSTFPAVAAAIGGGKGGEGTSALSAGVGATLGDTSGVQVGLDLFFFLFHLVVLACRCLFFLQTSSSHSTSTASQPPKKNKTQPLPQGKAKGWSPTMGAYTAPAPAGGEEAH